MPSVEIINQKAPVDGAVESARVNYDELGRVVVDMQMDSQGAKDWKTLTGKNVRKTCCGDFG